MAEIEARNDAKTANWYVLQDVLDNQEMAFDHKDMLKVFLAKR